MNLTPYVTRFPEEHEAALRLMLLEALSEAADEITRELAPGSVELRLRAGEAEFAVAQPAAEPVEAGPRAARDRRGRDRPHQPPPARAPQGGRRGGRRSRAAVRQFLARPRHRVRAGPGRASAVRQGADRPVLHRMGALMPTFDTREPISATVDVVTGDVRITAGDVATTVVEVRPSDASNQEDVRAAEQTRVEYADGAPAGQGAKVALSGRHAATAARSTSRSSSPPARISTARARWRTTTPTAASATSGSRPAWAGSTSRRRPSCTSRPASATSTSTT